ncbi:MAG: GNAT family N-acetyltransferase [Chloroflexi bacterium]|nr:GNAT family N-acetyltransferase [Chloroflexota bacterium]MXV81498.1 GNAT family N-acetyltransferase [Chloroflexota bacterium]MXX49351.1 GNAT family N-acetyltransferase [Chloroflexota bacterium]MXY85220.1 GNAT family N-acetyltransferase [Chloroflexota bacterium]MYC01602.1 GNAT family N-acetyltransferase [Chloroflexota bacterium]
MTTDASARQAALIARRYPSRATLRGGREIDMRLMSPADKARFLAFARSLSTDDLLYLPWDITDEGVVDRWLENIAQHRTTTVLAVDSGDIVGEASLVHNEAGWTNHIGEIRVTVNSQIRGQGLGRFLAEEIFAIADSIGLERISARMTHDQLSAQAVFESLGFQPVATLPGWVMDRSGRLRDLVMMAYDLRARGAPTSAQR